MVFFAVLCCFFVYVLCFTVALFCFSSVTHTIWIALFSSLLICSGFHVCFCLVVGAEWVKKSKTFPILLAETLWRRSPTTRFQSWSKSSNNLPHGTHSHEAGRGHKIFFTRWHDIKTRREQKNCRAISQWKDKKRFLLPSFCFHRLILCFNITCLFVQERASGDFPCLFPAGWWLEWSRDLLHVCHHLCPLTHKLGRSGTEEGIMTASDPGGANT